jgi:hypothetical protein
MEDTTMARHIQGRTSVGWSRCNVICWRLYGGQAPGQIAEMVFTNSRSGKQADLTQNQAEAAVRFAAADLCPDAAPKA